jgi:Pentapeptide repeats (8 copies)
MQRFVLIVSACGSVDRRPALTNPESTAATNGTQSAGKRAAPRKRRSSSLGWVKKHLWWGLLAVAVGSLVAFVVAVIWYRPTEESREPMLLALGGTTIVAWIGLGLWKIPQVQARNAPIEEGGKTRFEIENDARKTLGEIVSGLGVVAGLLFTWYQINDSRNATEQSLRTTQQGQITSRFSQAVDQLGSDAVDVRVGGIYSLEQIALDAPDDFYRPVMEVLAGYVRAHNQYGQPAENPEGPSVQANGQTLDVRAAVIVLTRRPDPPSGSEGLRLSLAGVDFRTMSLTRANLAGVDLSNAHLEGANLGEADLEGAILSGTFTSGMLPANFTLACLQSADLSRSDISPGQIDLAITDRTTILPDGTNPSVDEADCG